MTGVPKTPKILLSENEFFRGFLRPEFSVEHAAVWFWARSEERDHDQGTEGGNGRQAAAAR